MIAEIDDWISKGSIDLCLVIGTTATVSPASSYVQAARKKGARVVVVNMDSKELGSAGSLRKGDFLFKGDAALILPEILKPVIGELEGLIGAEGEKVEMQ
jgi:NAD+-dependent protein deacetylase sirtuin 5